MTPCWITKMSAEAVSGKCCNCGYHGKYETPCPNRPDATHCEHWWDGPDVDCVGNTGKEAGGMTPKQRAFDALRAFAPLWGGRTDDPCDMVVQAAADAIIAAVAEEREVCARVAEKNLSVDSGDPARWTDDVVVRIAVAIRNVIARGESYAKTQEQKENLLALSQKATEMTGKLKTVITAGQPDELALLEARVGDVLIRRMPDDPLGVLRASLGESLMLPKSTYLVIRGDPVRITMLLHRALQAMEQRF